MNHVPTNLIAQGAQPVRTTRRALAKQRTREKILAAARQLFTERGYEGATIRDIAKAAGMSTGAVFASFSDKSELFDEIVAADYLGLATEARAAFEATGNVDEALTAIVRTAYTFHLSQAPLSRAGLSVAWTRDAAGENRNREALKPLAELFLDALRRGVEAGELKADADLGLVRAILWDVYLGGYRAGLFAGRGAEELAARFGEQTKVILASART